jgi:hypothetical protein
MKTAVQFTVERMISERQSLDKIEEFIDEQPLDAETKAALALLSWACYGLGIEPRHIGPVVLVEMSDEHAATLWIPPAPPSPAAPWARSTEQLKPHRTNQPPPKGGPVQMEVLTEVPRTGTKLRFDSDRHFDRPTGDSVIRVQGQSTDGAQVIDAGYVECSSDEARLIALLIREVADPSPETKDRLAQEVQAMHSARLSGRDARQIAEVASREWWTAIRAASPLLGTEREAGGIATRLAERFERASATMATPFATNGESERD